MQVCKDVTVQCVCAHWIEDINPVQTQQQGKIYPSLANTPCQLPIIMISSQVPFPLKQAFSSLTSLETMRSGCMAWHTTMSTFCSALPPQGAVLGSI